MEVGSGLNWKGGGEEPRDLEKRTRGASCSDSFFISSLSPERLRGTGGRIPGQSRDAYADKRG